MATTPEGRIKKRLANKLKELGVWYFFPAAGAFGRSGIPDVIAIWHGRFIGIECKSDPSKKPTALQEKAGREIKSAGGLWYLVRSYQDIDNLINELGDLQ